VVEGGGAGGGDDGQAFEEFPELAGAFLRFEEYAVATDGGEADGFAVANLLVGEGGSDFDGVLFGGLVAVARLDGTLHVEEEPDADGGLEVEFLDMMRPVRAVESQWMRLKAWPGTNSRMVEASEVICWVRCWERVLPNWEPAGIWKSGMTLMGGRRRRCCAGEIRIWRRRC